MEFRSWQQVRAESGVSEEEIAVYRRLMDAEAALEQRRLRLGVDEETMAGALEAADRDEIPPDLYLDVLTRFTAALGGRVEVRAVFPDEEVTLWRQPDDPATSSRP